MSLDGRVGGSLETQLMPMLPMGQPGIRVMAERLELALTMPCIPLPYLSSSLPPGLPLAFLWQRVGWKIAGNDYYSPYSTHVSPCTTWCYFMSMSEQQPLSGPSSLAPPGLPAAPAPTAKRPQLPAASRPPALKKQSPPLKSKSRVAPSRSLLKPG